MQSRQTGDLYRHVELALSLLDKITEFEGPQHFEHIIADFLELDCIDSFIQSRSDSGRCYGCGQCIQKEAVKQVTCMREIDTASCKPK